jgi:hypothetical protein
MMPCSPKLQRAKRPERWRGPSVIIVNISKRGILNGLSLANQIA